MAMTIRLDEEQELRLRELAAARHTSKAAVLKQALDEKYERERHAKRVEDAADFFRRRDAGLLRRLGES